MPTLEDGVTIIPTGRPCWGCIDLLTERIPMVGEDFYCIADWRELCPPVLIGRIRKIMDGCIVPRELKKGCCRGKQ